MPLNHNPPHVRRLNSFISYQMHDKWIAKVFSAIILLLFPQFFCPVYHYRNITPNSCSWSATANRRTQEPPLKFIVCSWAWMHLLHPSATSHHLVRVRLELIHLVQRSANHMHVCWSRRSMDTEINTCEMLFLPQVYALSFQPEGTVHRHSFSLLELCRKNCVQWFKLIIVKSRLDLEDLKTEVQQFGSVNPTLPFPRQ